MEIAGAEALEGGRDVIHRVVIDLFDVDVFGIVIGLALFGADVAVGNPFDDGVGAVGNDVAGLNPLFAKLFDQMHGHREGCVVGERVDKIRRGLFEREFDGLVIDYTYAQLVGFHLAGVDRFGVLDGILQIGVVRRPFRIEQTLEGVFEILGLDRLAIAPDGIFADGEGVNQAIIGDCVIGSLAQHRLGVRIFGHQTFEIIADDAVFPIARHAVRIDGGRLAAVEHVECFRRGGTRHCHCHEAGKDAARKGMLEIHDGRLL